MKKLFPNYGIILSDKDPMPLFGLKLLSAIVERNPAFVTILKKLKLIGILIDYFTVGHPKFNSFTVKIVKLIVESNETDLEELNQAGITSKANAIIRNTSKSNNADWCQDLLLDIVFGLLQKCAEVSKNDSKLKVAQETFISLVNIFELIVNYLDSGDGLVVDKSS